MQDVLTEELTLHVQREVDIAAPIEIAFEAMLEQIGPGTERPDGTPMPLTLEAWPGARYYRDLGDNAGHLWGHVQVIKPPTLLEICGPLFMSYPALNWVQYRLAAQGRGTRLTLTHRALGDISSDHRSGVHRGWDHILKRVKDRAER